MVAVLTVLEGEIGEKIPTHPATPEKVQSVRISTGCHSGIEGVAVNGVGGWYFSPPDPDESGGGKYRRNRFHTNTEDLVDIVLRYLEGGSATHEGKRGCLIMVDGQQYGNNGDSEKRRLLLGPDSVRYLLHLS